MGGPKEQFVPRLREKNSSDVATPRSIIDDYLQGAGEYLTQISAEGILRSAVPRLVLLGGLSALSKGRALPRALILGLTAEQRLRLALHIQSFAGNLFRGGVASDADSAHYRKLAGADLTAIGVELVSAKASGPLVSMVTKGKLSQPARSTTLAMQRSVEGHFVPPSKPSVGSLSLLPFENNAPFVAADHFGYERRYAPSRSILNSERFGEERFTNSSTGHAALRAPGTRHSEHRSRFSIPQIDSRTIVPLWTQSTQACVRR